MKIIINILSLLTELAALVCFIYGVLAMIRGFISGDHSKMIAYLIVAVILAIVSVILHKIGERMDD